MQTEQLQKVLEQVKNGEITIDKAIEELRHLPFEDLGFAHIDHHRQIRCGLPEVIYCPGKKLKLSEDINSRGLHFAVFCDNGSKCNACSRCYIICPDTAIEVYK